MGAVLTATVATLARYLMHDTGHHRLVIDPAADNEPAIAATRRWASALWQRVRCAGLSRRGSGDGVRPLPLLGFLTVSGLLLWQAVSGLS